MQFTPVILSSLIKSVAKTIEENTEEVTSLDQVLGDGDHVINLQRGIEALLKQDNELIELEWKQAIQKVGMTLLSTMGGASGSLFGTLFISMSKAMENEMTLNQQDFSNAFSLGVEAVKKRGKSDAGEKTMLDVLIPVANKIEKDVNASVKFPELLENICQTAKEGMESTRDMIATKGRASYMEEKSLGHIDAGARTSQLMICAMTDILKDSA